MARGMGEKFTEGQKFEFVIGYFEAIHQQVHEMVVYATTGNGPCSCCEYNSTFEATYKAAIHLGTVSGSGEKPPKPFTSWYQMAMFYKAENEDAVMNWNDTRGELERVMANNTELAKSIGMHKEYTTRTGNKLKLAIDALNDLVFKLKA